jgi:hypothetical protein
LEDEIEKNQKNNAKFWEKEKKKKTRKNKKVKPGAQAR